MSEKFVYCFECTQAAENGEFGVFFCDEDIYHRVVDDEPEAGEKL